MGANWPERRIIETALSGKGGFDDGDWIEAPYITGEGIRLIQTGNVGIGEFIDKPEQRRFVSERTFRTLGCKWVYPGDILLCRLADPIGRACRVPYEVGNSITAVDCTIYRPDPATTEARFALHWFNSAWHLKAAQDVAGGSTRQRISRGHLGRLKLPSPPLPEQRQIAAILDTIDDVIRKTEQIIAKLKQVKQGLLHDLLTRGIDDNGELRDLQRHPEQFKDSPLGRIPQGWAAAPAGELCSLITKGTTPPPGAFRTDERSVRYLRVDNLTFSGALELSLPPLFIDRRTHETALARSRVQANDVLMNIVGPPLGKVSIVPGAAHAWNVNQAIAIFRLRDGISPLFLATWLLSGAKKWFHREAKQTSGQVNLTLEMCASVPIPVPSETEQKRILLVLAGIDSRLTNEGAELAKLSLLKAGLMEDLLTGRVRVTKLLESAAE